MNEELTARLSFSLYLSLAQDPSRCVGKPIEITNSVQRVLTNGFLLLQFVHSTSAHFFKSHAVVYTLRLMPSVADNGSFRNTVDDLGVPLFHLASPCTIRDETHGSCHEMLKCSATQTYP